MGDEPSYIGAMLPICQSHKEDEDHVHLYTGTLCHGSYISDAELSEDNDFDHEPEIEHERAQGNIVSCKEYRKEDDRLKDKEDRIAEAHYETAGCGDTLSALEFKVEGEVVAQDRTGCRIYLKEGKDVRVGFMEYEPGDKNGDQGF